MHRTLALVSLIGVFALGLAVAGCGGDDNGDGGSGDQGTVSAQSDEAAVREVIGQVRAASASGDANKFCALFEPSRLEEWLGEEDCVKVFGPPLKSDNKTTDFKISKVKVDGDDATVTLERGQTTTLNKIDGQWYLETPDIEVPDEEAEQ